LESGPAAAPTQAEIDAASRRRAIDALERAVARMTRAVGRDWQHCGKAACLRSRRCRGFVCEPEIGDEEA
jgi:hypothetical protein